MDPISISQLVNDALDKAYKQTAGLVLKQIDLLTKSPGGSLQRALQRLDDEATRLDQAGEMMRNDNPVLVQALRVVEDTYKMTAELIKTSDSAIQSSGVMIALPAVTSKVFRPMAQMAIIQGFDPLSSQALDFYLATLKGTQSVWKTK